MSETANTSATASANAAAPIYQNYILYRTVAKTFQPGSYVGPDGKTVTPPVVTAEAAGYVVGAQLLDGLEGVVVPDGFAYALDADKAYPVGSIYTPPAATAPTTTTTTTGTTTAS